MAIALSSGATNFTATITASPTATRTITVPDSDFTMTGNDLTQTLTNKTLTSPTITNELATTIRETITISATAATGTIDYDAITQSILYYTTDASGNFTVNFRGNSGTSLDSVMSTGRIFVCHFLGDQCRYCLLQLCCTGRRFFSHSQVARWLCTDSWQCKLN
jgi:hypothetical protein